MLKSKIEVKCYICSSTMFVAHSTYVHKHKPWKCRKCLANESKIRYKNLPESEKLRRAKMSSSNMKLIWKNMCDDEKNYRLSKLNDGFRSYFDNLPDEDKNKNSIYHSIIMKNVWENRSEEERKRIIAPMLEASHNWLNSLSDDEMKEFHKYIQNGNKKWWEGLSEEEKLVYSQIRSISSQEYWNNITDEERIAIGLRQSMIISKYWNDMTDEEYLIWDEKRRNGFNKYMEQLPFIMNNTEKAISKIIYDNNISFKFHWYNKTKHPDFDKLFPFNPVTGSKFVSPYHQWDFIINTLNKNILVDIDGSIHDPNKISHEITYFNGKKLNLIDIVKFNDSKRPYQTDGLDAYIIQCYDDNLTNDSNVINIKNNTMMSFHQLMALIEINNLSKKELKSLFKSD